MKIKLHKGDITELEVNAIVNPANRSLLGGAGLDGIIHRKGGVSILEECKNHIKENVEFKFGDVILTTSGNLKCEHILHAIGPIWIDGNSKEVEDLKKTYLNCLKLSYEFSIKTIAFPNISTGVYAFPKELAAEIVTETFYEIKDNIKYKDFEITFCCFDEENYNLYKEKLKKLNIYE